MFSPVVTIGGGTILDIAPPRVKQPCERLKRLDGAPPSEVLAALVRESRNGCSLSELVRRTGLTAAEINDAGLTRVAGVEAWFVDPGWLAALRARVFEELRAFHAANPLQAGMPKEDLRARLLPEAPVFLLDSVLAGWATVAAEGDRVRLSSHRVAFQGDEEEALKRIESAFETAGLTAPGVGGVLAGCGVEAHRARQLLQILLRNRRLIRVSEELVIHASAAARLKEMLAPRRGQRFSVPEFKEWTGISRKFAIPLLEFLDREKVTRREGDQRVVL
jgi:selenocysteine-specific elongation factor